MTHAHFGHVFHIAGNPLVTGAADALVSIPDGALVYGDDGKIAYVGEREALPDEYSDAEVHDHRPAFLLPGFVDTHIHFPQTYAGDAYGGGQLLEWLNACIMPSESLYADPDYAQRAPRSSPGGASPREPRRPWCSVRRSRTRRIRCSPRPRKRACASSRAGVSRPAAASRHSR